MRRLALALAVVVTVTGCARFDDRLDGEFSPAPEPGAMEAPRPPDRGGPPPFTPPPESSQGAPPPESGPCVDPDPAVVATCLEPSRAVASIGVNALVVEPGGRALVVSPDADPVEFGRVDARGGRVVAVAPSPDFEQDRLVYALVVDPGGSRIERLARGDVSRTVADLDPATGGGLLFDGKVLTVGIGDRLLRFPGFSGIGRAGAPEVVASGLGDVRGLCHDGEKVLATTVTPRGVVARDARTVVWTWPDQTEVGGCVATPEALGVALPAAKRVDVLPLAAGGPAGEPQPLAENTYGRLTGLAVVADALVLATTTNKDGGQPVPTDDRAVVLPLQASGGADSQV